MTKKAKTREDIALGDIELEFKTPEAVWTFQCSECQLINKTESEKIVRKYKPRVYLIVLAVLMILGAVVAIVIFTRFDSGTIVIQNKTAENLEYAEDQF